MNPVPRHYSWSELAHLSPKNGMGRHYVEASEHDRIVRDLQNDFYLSNQVVARLEAALKMYTDKDKRRNYQKTRRKEREA